MSEEYQVVQYTKELERRLYNIRDYKPRPRVSSADPIGGGEAVVYDSDPFSTYSTITVRNTTQDNIQAYSALKLMPTTPARIGPDGMYDALVYNVGKPANGEVCSLCVNLDYLPAGGTCVAVVSGVVPVRTENTGYYSAGRQCAPDGNYNLVSRDEEGYVTCIAQLTSWRIVVSLGGMSAPLGSKATGEFDARGVTEDGADGIEIYDSSNPDSEYCGYVVIASKTKRMSKQFIALSGSSGSIFLKVTYDQGLNDYAAEFTIGQSPSSPTIFQQSIASYRWSGGKYLANPSRSLGSVIVKDRWLA